MHSKSTRQVLGWLRTQLRPPVLEGGNTLDAGTDLYSAYEHQYPGSHLAFLVVRAHIDQPRVGLTYNGAEAKEQQQRSCERSNRRDQVEQ